MKNQLSMRRSPIVGVGALILRLDGFFLIGHRTKHGEPESWCLPGGHLEAGESFESAAKREVSEETGIDLIGDLKVFTFLLNTNADFPHVTAGVTAHVGNNTAINNLEPDVFSSWIWANFNDLPTPLFPASAALIASWKGVNLLPGWTQYPIKTTLSPFLQEE